VNRARIAEIHRELARLHEELAEELADDAPAEREERPAKRTPRARSFPAPLGKATDIDRARASRMLKRRGYAT